MNKCQEMVYVKDTYRYTGRTPSRFEMHYRYRQCSRNAKPNAYCWQHQASAAIADAKGLNTPTTGSA